MQRLPIPSRADHPGSAGRDRRQTARYPRKANMVGHLVAFVKNDRLFGWVRNVSAGGVCLELRQPVKAGEFVSMELRNILLGYSLTRPVQVVYSLPLHRAGCVLGGRFLQELSDDQLQALLY